MNEAIQAVISVLTARHIDYTLVEHIPVYTIDEMAALHLPGSDAVAKTSSFVTIKRETTTSSSFIRKKRLISSP